MCYNLIKDKYVLMEGAKKMKQRISTALITIAMCAVVSAYFAGANSIPGQSYDDGMIPRVFVNGKKLDADVIMKNDRTYIPLRAVSESMGAEVLWDAETECAYVNFTEDDQIAKLVENVSPSVVAIIGNYYSGDTTVNQYNQPTAHGSGVIYKSNGYILTNHHVVTGVKNLTVVLNDGTALPGTVLYSDETADLAVVKINKLGLKAMKFADMSTVVSGKTAIAIGTPVSMSMRNTVTKGIVSSPSVSISDSYYKLIQTDTTINPGNSGGALINTKGELIGITSSKYVGGGIENIAFAIPVDTVEYALAHFEAFGGIVRPDFGVSLEQSWEAKIGLPTTKGLTVKSFPAGAVLDKGDVIFEVNGVKVSSIVEWNEAIKSTYYGNPLKIKYRKGGEAGQTAETELSAIVK